MSKAGWGAQLRGVGLDIEEWTQALTGAADPWIELLDGNAVLRSRHFADAKTAEEVSVLAPPLIATLNGAFAVFDGLQPVFFDAVVAIDDTGEVRRYFFESILETISVRARIGTHDDGSGESVVQTWMAAASTSPPLNDALVYFGRSSSWFDMFKVLESLRALAGSKHKLLAKGWAPEEDVVLLADTANGYRHARGSAKRPRTPMDKLTARALLGRLLRHALSEARDAAATNNGKTHQTDRA